MNEFKFELTVRDLQGRPHSHYVKREVVAVELSIESLRLDINQIILTTTIPLGCVVIEAQKDAKNGWVIHRKADICLGIWESAITEPITYRNQKPVSVGNCRHGNQQTKDLVCRICAEIEIERRDNVIASMRDEFEEVIDCASDTNPDRAVAAAQKALLLDKFT